MAGKRLGIAKAIPVVLMLQFGLSACSGDLNIGIADLKAGPDESPSSTPAGSKPEEQEVTLSFYFGGDRKAATDEVWSKVSAYVKSKGLNVNFSVHFIPWPDYSSKLLVMAASGDTWDLNFDSDNSFQQMAARGSYMALNELLPEYAPHLYAKYRDQNTLAAATVNGAIVGMPWTVKMNQRVYAGWREDLAAKAGIVRAPGSVRTVGDVDKLLHELKQAYPNAKLTRTSALPLYIVRDEWVDLGFHGLGFYMNDPDITVRAIEQQPFYEEAALMSKRWYDDQILNRDVLLDTESAADQWRNGKMLFTITSHEWAYAADPGFVDASYKQQMSLMYPDKKFVNRSPIANVLAINRNSDRADRVLRFLDMMETDRTLYDLVIYGIEGKTYVLNGNTALYPGDMQFSTSNYMDWGGQWAFWNPQFMRATETYPAGFWQEETNFAELPTNVPSPVEGIFLSDSSIVDELAKRDQLYEDAGKPIEYGTVPQIGPAVDAYVEQQKAGGLDAIIANVQKQVDQYIAARKRD